MTADQLTITFAALADPTRRAILARLAEGEATVNQLAEPFPITLQAVSKHLKVLEPERLVLEEPAEGAWHEGAVSVLTLTDLGEHLA